MTRPPVEYRPMTDDEQKMARALLPGRVSYRAGTADKAFANRMWTAVGLHSPVISEGQAHYLRRMVWTYRRQLASDVRALVPADPTDAQKPVKDPSPKKRTKRRFDGLDLWGGRDDA